MHSAPRSIVTATIGSVLCVSLVLSGGCNRESASGDDSLSRDEARQKQGRGDDGEDLCQLLGFYDDGRCDDFCIRRDPDCSRSSDGGAGDGSTSSDSGPSEDGGSGRACGSRGLDPCRDGEFCKFAQSAMCGAADKPGVCATIPEVCPEIYGPVCGCDGQTYDNDCFANAAGVSAATTGNCEGGAICGGLNGTGCADGEYCNIPPLSMCGAADQTGTCQVKPEACTQEYDPVCGCDDQTYGNACSAAGAGVSVARSGECGKSCGGKVPSGTDNTCAAEEYCFYTPEAGCGYADATGTCQPRPMACDSVLEPVCGCDGQTYDNECEAAVAGTGTYHSGACN